MVGPIFDSIEPRKREWEGGVVPAPPDPCRMVNHSERSKRLDQHYRSRVERTKHRVRLEQVGQNGFLVLTIPRQKHPQILDRRPGLRVVEVDEIGRVVTPQ